MNSIISKKRNINKIIQWRKCDFFVKSIEKNIFIVIIQMNIKIKTWGEKNDRIQKRKQNI